MKEIIFLYLLNLLSISAKEFRIVAIGDSLTAGYGVESEFSYPSVLEKELIKKYPDIKVINAGVSGATSATGLVQLKWQLKREIDLIILCLGANDGLRGLDLNETEKNMNQMILLAKKKKIKILLAGMKLPLNYGKEYLTKFISMYPNLAKKHNLILMPYFLEGVGGEKSLNLSDGIHPNKDGYKIIVKNLLPYIEKLL